MRFLLTNTDQYVTVGPAIDITDGIALLDAMTATNVKGIFTIQTHAAAATDSDEFTCSATGSADWGLVAHGHGGMYQIKIPDSAINFVGSGSLTLYDPDVMLPIGPIDFEVVPANVWNSLFGTDLLDVNQAQYLGAACHAASEAGTACVEVVRWGGNDVPATGINGTPKVDVAGYNGTAAHAADTAGIIPVGVHQWAGTDVHAATVAGVPVVQLHTAAGGIDGPAAFPTNFEDLSITDTTGLVSCPSTQKVDVETIKTQAVTCAAGVTVLASVGTAATSTAQTGDSYAIVNGDHGLVSVQDDVDEILTRLPDATAGAAGGLAIVGSVMGKSPATLAAGDVTGNLPVDLKAITAGVDLSDTMKASVTSAVPTAAAVATAVRDVDNTTPAADSLGEAVNAATTGGVTASDIRSAIGLASANLDTQLAALPTDADVNAACDTAISDAALATAANLADLHTDVGTAITNIATVDGVADAIKVQTDKLTFTVANQVDANVQSINDAGLTGDGSATPFNVA